MLWIILWISFLSFFIIVFYLYKKIRKSKNIGFYKIDLKVIYVFNFSFFFNKK